MLSAHPRLWLSFMLLTVTGNGTAGCLDTFRSKNFDHAQQTISSKSDTAAHPDHNVVDSGVGPESSTDVNEAEREENHMEDHDALAELITQRLSSPEETSSPSSGTETEHADAPPLIDIDALTAQQNLRLSPKGCKRRLRQRGIAFEPPHFKTPLVHTPLLLTQPIDGVTIAPRWPKKKPSHAVMDCHLLLALADTASVAKQFGIKEMLFYSTYRAITVPPKTCAKGRRGKRCRKLKKQYAKIKRSQTSQHRFARAIDIRWLVTEEGKTLDVLEHFERRSGVAPCSYTPKTEDARRLSGFVCALHERRIFNVLLTPNANKAHHNHFHFDITPNATWYIIR